MTIKQLSVFVENKLGRLAQITDVIGRAGVDIRALSIADTSDFGILRLIVDQPEKAVEALRNTGATVSLTEVIAVGIPDRPGAFSEVIALMSTANISIEYMYAFISRTNDTAYVIMRVENPEQGAALLKERGVTILDSDAIYHM